MMNDELLRLLERYVPRSIIRDLVGKQFFDALVSFNSSLDIYSVEVLAEKLRMSRASLKAAFKYCKSSLTLSERDFIRKFYIQKEVEIQSELRHVKPVRKLHDFQYRAFRSVLQKLHNGEKKSYYTCQLSRKNTYSG